MGKRGVFLSRIQGHSVASCTFRKNRRRGCTIAVREVDGSELMRNFDAIEPDKRPSISRLTHYIWLTATRATPYVGFGSGDPRLWRAVLIGNLVRLQDCPAAVSENDHRHTH